VKLLFDQNLSRHLVGQLAREFPDSRHVTEVGLDTATDREIWDFAGGQGFVIVSKDSDFRQLAFLLGPPPKAIWLPWGTRRRSTSSTCFGAINRRSTTSTTPRRKRFWFCPRSPSARRRPAARPGQALRPGWDAREFAENTVGSTL
jgi:predicted nuclease of predicted toxin-antitoxin system